MLFWTDSLGRHTAAPDTVAPARRDPDLSAIPANEPAVVDSIREHFAGLVGTETYEKHFRTTARLRYDGRQVCVDVPTLFHKKMLGRRFGDPIAQAACAALGALSVRTS